MGLANAVKDMFRSNSSSSDEAGDTRRSDFVGHTNSNKFPDATSTGTLRQDASAHSPSHNASHHNNVGADRTSATQINSDQYKLPAGTGPGTLGKGGSEAGDNLNGNDRMNNGVDDNSGRARNASVSYGGKTGAAGTGAPGHNAPSRGSPRADTDQLDIEGNRLNPSHNRHSKSKDERGASANGVNMNEFHAGDRTPQTGMGRHDAGHVSNNSPDVMPSGNTTEDHKHLQHVTHNRVKHIETEEVLRERQHDRHVHHVQHHVQPIQHRDVREEVHHENVVPVTHINEQHSNKDRDTEVLHGIVGQHTDSVSHAPKERTVIDKGEVVNENVHHHVHHVVQPVIEKETLDRHRIHTVIPSHHVTHEAPIIHQSHTHEPVTMDEFMKTGKLQDGIAHDQLADRVLNTGECTREVDGLGEQIARDLHVGTFSHNHTGNSGAGPVDNPAHRFGTDSAHPGRNQLHKQSEVGGGSTKPFDRSADMFEAQRAE